MENSNPENKKLPRIQIIRRTRTLEYDLLRTIEEQRVENPQILLCHHCNTPLLWVPASAAVAPFVITCSRCVGGDVVFALTPEQVKWAVESGEVSEEELYVVKIKKEPSEDETPKK